jgi:hypothetical protein
MTDHCHLTDDFIKENITNGGRNASLNILQYPWDRVEIDTRVLIENVKHVIQANAEAAPRLTDEWLKNQAIISCNKVDHDADGGFNAWFHFARAIEARILGGQA